MRRQRLDRRPQYESADYRELQLRLSTNLRRLRAARGWSQRLASEHCDMLEQHYFRAETAKVNVTFTTLARLAHGFGVDVCELLSASMPIEVSDVSSRSGGT
jgi:transcriptional regulator with XRE-family HTH domain